MARRTRRRAVLLLGLLGLVAGPADALTDEEVFRNFRFNLINPGARSLALGGAFLSLADDATAAQANPSGLGFLTTWEAFAEIRSIDSGAQASILTETLPGGVQTLLATGSDIDDIVRPSFLSGVANFTKGDGLKWSLGFSRQELLNIENSTLSSFTLTFEDTPGAFVAQGQGAIDLGVVNWNLSAGFRITDHFGVGATLTYSALDVVSDVTNVVLDTSGGVVGQPVLEPTLDIRTTVDDTDDDWIYSLGLIYQADRWGVGAVYREGPEFSVDEQIVLTAKGSTVETGIDVFDVRPTLGSEVQNRFGLPDVLGVGGHWRPTGKLTLALNVERIFYSNLLDGFVAGVNVLTDFDATFEIDDSTDARFGAEYLFFPKNWPVLALRGGVYSEGDSTMRARDTGTRSLATEEVFSGTGDQTHGTIGLGIVFARTKLDLAADFAETDNEFVISFIYKGKQ